jgi:hypothetical protein
VGDSNNFPVVSRGEEVDDDVPHDERTPMVTRAQSLVSLVDVEVWPEMWARRVMAKTSICCELNQTKNVRGGAGERGRR